LSARSPTSAQPGNACGIFKPFHHDLWDYDLTTAPKLLTVQHNGKPVDIVAQATKFGFLFVLNRVTGEPLWAIEERPVPKRRHARRGIVAHQPFPTKPPPYCAAEVHPRGDQSVPRSGRDRAPAQDPARRAQRWRLHAPSA
jgi:quinoprotein glucose dehydrogenase